MGGEKTKNLFYYQNSYEISDKGEFAFCSICIS